jgi:hypothetical protein
MINLPNILNPELGYYSCNSQLFTSKIQACIYGTKSKFPVKWHFNDDVFDNYPWHIEPAENLDELYNKRAREIREKYDYVMLAFSGGGDSNNVLESFLRQGLLIDEIVTNVMGDCNSVTILDPNVIENWNEAAEFKFQTLPRLQYVKNVSPKTKITTLDLSTYVLKFFNEQKDESWLNFTKERLNVSGLLRHNFIHFNEVRKQFDKGKKIAMVLGIEKPRTYIGSDGNFYIRFTDRATNLVTVAEYYQEYTNSKVEYFYWSKDSTQILAKQGHVIKKWLMAFPQYQTLWQGATLTPERFRIVHERLLRSLLYTTWNDSWYQSDKATKDWYSEFDDWFIKGHEGNTAHHVWLEGLSYVQNNLSPYIKLDAAGKADGLISYSHDYCLGKFNS